MCVHMYLHVCVFLRRLHIVSECDCVVACVVCVQVCVCAGACAHAHVYVCLQNMCVCRREREREAGLSFCVDSVHFHASVSVWERGQGCRMDVPKWQVCWCEL